jgi:hypothetical protein
MTGRDNSPKGFLERWSRKKIESDGEASPDQPAAPARPAADDAKPRAEGEPKPEFDLASLPSLESITAATDIRAFLGPGVPKALARAALRRAWSIDPAIRDFKGLAENDWDFNDPNAMPGFGALPEDCDITKLMTQIFGEDEKPVVPEAAASPPAIMREDSIAGDDAPPASLVQTTPPDPSDKPTNAQALPAEPQVGSSDFVQRDNNIAMHNSIPSDETAERKNRRQHGGALPQ